MFLLSLELSVIWGIEMDRNALKIDRNDIGEWISEHIANIKNKNVTTYRIIADVI